MTFKCSLSIRKICLSRKAPFVCIISIIFYRAECEEKVKNYKGARYKKFPTREAAEEFISAYYVEGKDILYKPDGAAIPPKPKKKQEEDDDFWPPCDGDDCYLTDDDLVKEKDIKIVKK